MASSSLSRMIVNSLKAILGEDYTVLSFEKLPSRRNDVYKVIGSDSSQSIPTFLVAKFYRQAGIAHETSILQKAYQHNLHVPAIIGTTADVIILEYIDAPNLCDLITINPDIMLGKMLGSWFANYHTVFSRGGDQVLTKGDARIHNFLVQQTHLVGVDFEESHIGSYVEDLAVVCASILDTTPIFTKPKLKLCTVILGQYAQLRQIRNRQQLNSATYTQMIQVLHETAIRRGNPPHLLRCINQFEKVPFPL